MAIYQYIDTVPSNIQDIDESGVGMATAAQDNRFKTRNPSDGGVMPHIDSEKLIYHVITV